MTVESLLTVNNLGTNPESVVNNLERASVQSLYRSTLKIQMDIYLDEILRYLGNHPEWLTAKAVLDLGCGPGDLIAHLSGHCPDKFYTGVDINEAFIKTAREQTSERNNCEFCCADLYDFNEGVYDVIILRAVLQHLDDPNRFMQHVSRLLNDNAAMIFNDTPNENFIVSSPAIPTFDDFYNQLGKAQRAGGGNRDCLAELEGSLEEHGFALIDSCDRAIPITTDENRLRMIQYLILACFVTKQMFSMRVDIAGLFDDLLNWYGSEAPAMEVKTKWMMIRVQ